MLQIFHKKSSKGFTLIELLVVIAIIGVLASIVLASLNTARRKGRDAKRVSDIKQIQTALELYFDSYGEYPDVLADLSTAPNTFFPAEPKDPLSAAGGYFYNAYTTSAVPPVVGDDCDEATETCISYHLGSDLEDASNTALDTDFDQAGDVVDGADADGCANDTNRYCYDVRP